MDKRVKDILSSANIVDSKGESDTLKLWEGYREQATLWRAIAVLQLPTTFIAVVMAIIMWNTRSITLNVPQKPAPGIYLAQDVGDTEFIDVATEFINLIATYRSSVARRQFQEARKYLMEPVLSKFDLEMLGTELKTVESTSRTQIFFVDPSKTEIIRESPRDVVIRLEGERQKIIAGKEVDPQKTRFTLSMTTIPKNSLNPYGIVITNILDQSVE
jgi:hypothetical protein